MDSQALKGRSILVVEEEPHVARHLEDRFRQAGAKVFAAGKLRDALYLAEHPALSAAVVNLRRPTGARVPAALALGIPFMFPTATTPAKRRGRGQRLRW
jgi:DNA-binding response OmpR family regulator